MSLMIATKGWIGGGKSAITKIFYVLELSGEMEIRTELEGEMEIEIELKGEIEVETALEGVAKIYTELKGEIEWS